ncbi:MAG: Spy/CpxP family protein refolding chaperone [Saprospiraceae bacterium]
MNKKTTPYIIIVAILVLMNLATLATLWLRPMGPPPPGRPGAERFLVHELKLSPEQVNQFQQLREQHFAQTQALEREVRDGRRRIIEQLAKNPPDTAAAHAITRQNQANLVVLDSLLIQHFLQLRTICTPAQQEKLGRVFQESMRPPMDRHHKRR